jgi:hypothetical protein
MSQSKNITFGVIAILLGLLTIELLTRGAFYVFGRYGDWGYPANANVYRPYIGVAYQPYEGGKDRYGFLLDSNDDPQRDLTRKDVCEFRVFVLGGSTVVGRALKQIYGLDAIDDALPARLERLLNEQSSSGIVFSVINAGKGGYISVQSLLQHAFYIKYSLQPDYVLHFDGSNDSVGHPNVWPKGKYPGIRDNIHRYPEDVFSHLNAMTGIRGSLNALLLNLSEYSAFIFALHKTINDPDAWARLFLNKDDFKDSEFGMEEWVERHVNRYIYNVRLATRLGDRDTGVAYFFQPTLLPYMEQWMSSDELPFLDRSDYATEFHGYPLMESKQHYYFRVREEFKNLVTKNQFEFSIISDLSRLFDNESPAEYFHDHVHYLPRGRAIISKEIAAIIKPNIQKQIRLNHRFRQCLTEQ